MKGRRVYHKQCFNCMVMHILVWHYIDCCTIGNPKIFSGEHWAVYLNKVPVGDTGMVAVTDTVRFTAVV